MVLTDVGRKTLVYVNFNTWVGRAVCARELDSWRLCGSSSGDIELETCGVELGTTDAAGRVQS